MKTTKSYPADPAHEHRSRPDQQSKVGHYRTARDMAESHHDLSRDGNSAFTYDGALWRWSDSFRVWACCMLGTRREIMPQMEGAIPA